MCVFLRRGGGGGGGIGCLSSTRSLRFCTEQIISAKIILSGAVFMVQFNEEVQQHVLLPFFEICFLEQLNFSVSLDVNNCSDQNI